MSYTSGRGRFTRGMFWGCVKASPFIFLPFLLLFTETYLHLERLAGDYDRVRMNQEIKQLEDEIRALNTEKAELEAMDRINAAAAGYGLVEPNPRQIEVLRAQAVPEPAMREKGLDLARADAVPDDRVVDAGN